MAKIPEQRARKRIALVWFLGALVLFSLVLLQTVLGKYGDRVSDAWGWLMPTIMPTVSLILGVFVSDHLKKREITGAVDSFLFQAVFWISAFYLLVVSSTILLSPFTEMKPLEFMSLSSLWLGPLQGLACAGLGAFFVQAPAKTAEKKPD